MRVLGGRDFARHALGDADAGLFQGVNFVGIVGEKAHLTDPERAKNLGWHAKLALICLEAEPLVGFHGIEPAVLQRVGLEFGHEADPATFLLFVDENAGALLGNHGKRHLELLAAVAAQRAENVTREALRVNADERRSGLYVSHDQSHSLLGLGVWPGAQGKAMDQKITPACGKVRGGDLFHPGRRHP